MNTYTEKRNWGKFEKFSENENTTVKLLYIDMGQSLHLQTHASREEFWKIISGTPDIIIGDHSYKTKPGEEYNIPLGIKHKASAPKDSFVIILEISRGNFKEDDIVHY